MGTITEDFIAGAGDWNSLGGLVWDSVNHALVTPSVGSFGAVHNASYDASGVGPYMSASYDSANGTTRPGLVAFEIDATGTLIAYFNATGVNVTDGVTSDVNAMPDISTIPAWTFEFEYNESTGQLTATVDGQTASITTTPGLTIAHHPYVILVGTTTGASITGASFRAASAPVTLPSPDPGSPGSWPVTGPTVAPARWDFRVTEPDGTPLSTHPGDAGGSIGTQISLVLSDANEATTVWPSTLPVAKAVWDQWRNVGTPVLRGYRNGVVKFSGELVSATLDAGDDIGGLLTCHWRSGWGCVAGSTDDRAPLIAPQNHYSYPSTDQTLTAANLVGDFVAVYGAAITTSYAASGINVSGTILRGEPVARVIETLMLSPTGFEFIDQPLATAAISNIHFAPLIGTTTGLLINPLRCSVSLSPPVNVVAVFGDGPEIGFDQDAGSWAAYGARWFSQRGDNASQGELSSRAAGLLQPAPYPQIDWTPRPGLAPVAIADYGVGDLITVAHLVPGMGDTTYYAVRITRIDVTVAPDGTELVVDTNDMLVGSAQGSGGISATSWSGTAPRSRDDVLRALALTRRLATKGSVPTLKYVDSSALGGGLMIPAAGSVPAGMRIQWSRVGTPGPPWELWESDGATWKFIAWT